MRFLALALIAGSTLVPRPLKERAKLADRVVVVQVVSSRTEVRDGDPKKGMFTHTEVLVGETLKGPSGPGFERLTITQLGGKWGLWEAHVPGDATFMAGETALVLLKCSPTPSTCGLVGLSEGKVTFIGNDAFVYDLAANRHARRPVSDVLLEVRESLRVPVAAPTTVTR
jgi:hypothetical protein